jgi:phage baseplate assembly protein W
MAQFFDIDSTFSLNARGDIEIKEDDAAIKQAIQSIINTPTGFRSGTGFKNVSYGVGIKKYVFAQMTNFTSQSLADSLERHLTIFEPRINIIEINVIGKVEEKRYDVEIIYSLEGSSEELTFRTIINQI